MESSNLYIILLGSIMCVSPVNSFSDEYVELKQNGPTMLGGNITFQATIKSRSGNIPSGTFKYIWSDIIYPQHSYDSGPTNSIIFNWTVNYPRDIYTPGKYVATVSVWQKKYEIFFVPLDDAKIGFEITKQFNGNMIITQSNKTLENTFVSTTSSVNISINMKESDYDYIKKNATDTTVYWFIDCEYYGENSNFILPYNFTKPNTSHIVEAIVATSYQQEMNTTTELPTTILSPVSNTTEHNNTSTTVNSTISTTEEIMKAENENQMNNESTKMELSTSAIIDVHKQRNESFLLRGNLPDVVNITNPSSCLHSSIIPMDPNKTYGYFYTQVEARAPVANISVDGTNWIQPWEMLSLNVTCKGTGPFYKCLQFHRGVYNVTGNETCDNDELLPSCDFSIIHYFLEFSEHTILLFLKNNVSSQIYPLRITIYKATTQPQLSVVVIPVTCSLAAVVLIIFGVAYYIQSRARFNVEVANFDFGQINPEMEYKTFGERLRDSFNSAIRPGNERISVRSYKYGSMDRRQISGFKNNN